MSASFRSDLNVVEDDEGGAVRRVELGLHFADAHAGRISFDEKHADAAHTRATRAHGLRSATACNRHGYVYATSTVLQDGRDADCNGTCRGEKARSGTSCNPFFLAVHDVVITFAHSSSFDICNIAACPGLRDSERDVLLAADHWVADHFFDALTPELDNWWQSHAVDAKTTKHTTAPHSGEFIP